MGAQEAEQPLTHTLSHMYTLPHLPTLTPATHTLPQMQICSHVHTPTLTHTHTCPLTHSPICVPAHMYTLPH